MQTTHHILSVVFISSVNLHLYHIQGMVGGGWGLMQEHIHMSICKLQTSNIEIVCSNSNTVNSNHSIQPIYT